MTPTTLKALKLSIAHWDRLAKNKGKKGEAVGPEHCALCEMFLIGPNYCKGCPVSEKTGRASCSEAPYPAADALWKKYELKQKPDFLAVAKLELAFLKSLLPKKGKK